MLLHNLIVFCFDRGESNYIRVSSYGAHWVKDKKCPNRHNAYFLFICYIIVGPKIFYQIIVFLWGLIKLLFRQATIMYIYESNWMVEIKK